jgi:hypothetical protein
MQPLHPYLRRYEAHRAAMPPFLRRHMASQLLSAVRSCRPAAEVEREAQRAWIGRLERGAAGLPPPDSPSCEVPPSSPSASAPLRPFTVVPGALHAYDVDTYGYMRHPRRYDRWLEEYARTGTPPGYASDPDLDMSLYDDPLSDQEEAQQRADASGSCGSRFSEAPAGRGEFCDSPQAELSGSSCDEAEEQPAGLAPKGLGSAAQTPSSLFGPKDPTRPAGASLDTFASLSVPSARFASLAGLPNTCDSCPSARPAARRRRPELTRRVLFGRVPRLRSLLGRCALVVRSADGSLIAVFRTGMRRRLRHRAVVDGLECYTMEMQEMEAGAESEVEEPATVVGFAVFFGGCRGGAARSASHSLAGLPCARRSHPEAEGPQANEALVRFVRGFRRTAFSRATSCPHLFHVVASEEGATGAVLPLPEDLVVVDADWSSLAGFAPRGPADFYDNVIAPLGRRRIFVRVDSHKAMVDAFERLYLRYFEGVRAGDSRGEGRG